MPTWLYIATWILWSLLTAKELLLEIVLTKENSDPRSLIFGKAKRNTAGKRGTFIWFLFSVFWLSYVFFG